MPDLIDALLRLDADVAEMKRRVENSERHGTVHEVDTTKQRVRLRLGGSDDEPFLSPWVPYSQTAGEFKFHNPPSKGQQMTLRCPDGDFRQGCALPYTWSNENASPSDKGDEHVTTFGDSKQTVRKQQVKQQVGDKAVHDITPEKIIAQLESAVHEVLSRHISSKVGSSLVRVATSAVRAASRRIDLN